MNALLKEGEVASWLNIRLATLRRWRFEGRGPKFLKLGSAVRYRSADVQEWLQKCPSGGSTAYEQNLRLA